MYVARNPYKADLHALIRENYRQVFFDKEVQDIVLSHDTPQDRTRLNAVIKAMYATA